MSFSVEIYPYCLIGGESIRRRGKINFRIGFGGFGEKFYTS
jgi:hypothetical protein